MKRKCLKFLFAIFFIILVASVYAETPSVIVETLPQKPVFGMPWTVTILVNHPVPRDIDVLAPIFPGGLSLDLFTKMPRMIEDQIMTSFEYKFIINGFGEVVLEPFKVITPQDTTETDSIILEIAVPSEQRKIIPRIVWNNAPSQMFQGERATLSIRITGWNSSQPPPEFFMPEVPQGVLLALAPVSSTERAAGIAAKFTLIPLYTGDFRLPARVLHHDNYIFEIPALRIKLLEKTL
jgi:hypothetical protein